MAEKVANECGNCAFYLKPECPRKFSADTHTYRGLIACETFEPMADEEKRMFDPIVLKKPPRPRCPQCNRVLKEPWNACPYCGRKFISEDDTMLPKACPKCKRVLKGEWKTCPYCATDVMQPSRTIEYEGLDKPSDMWYLAPLLFGIIGGLIGYLGTKDSDKDMANNMLIFGLVWSFVLGLIGWAWITSLH